VSSAAEKRLEVRSITSATGDVIVVEGAEPVPIGTRVRMDPALVGLCEPGAEPLRGKVIDVRRKGDAYAVTLKLHSVTRAQRDAIASAKTSDCGSQRRDRAP
jgi:hypothetical protein